MLQPKETDATYFPKSYQRYSANMNIGMKQNLDGDDISTVIVESNSSKPREDNLYLSIMIRKEIQSSSNKNRRKKHELAKNQTTCEAYKCPTEGL